MSEQSRRFSEGQKAALRFMLVQPAHDFVYPDGHASAICNLVDKDNSTVERKRIKGRWHYRLTDHGREIAHQEQAKVASTCPVTRSH
ncbi:MAG: hypothetical protein ABF420_11460 [Acetobacter syzygii]|uniref:hypothetical protein n=1 Tax=Acetobacter syzygii TaxID=146476 RepID=UPI0039ECD6C5